MSKSAEEPLNAKYGTVDEENCDEGDKTEKNNEEYEKVYEEYRFGPQEHRRKETAVTVSNTQLIVENLSENISKKKFCLICSILVLVIGGTAVGLLIHFTTAPAANTIEPVVKDAVLALSTYSSNNVPMVIKLTSGIGLNGIWSNGESV